VTARRQLDTRTLRAVVPRFVESHAAPSVTTRQLARWHNSICAQTRGLQQPFADRVSQRIVAVAAEVRAPVDTHKDCRPNIEVVFTPTPQQQLDLISKERPDLLGVYWGPDYKKLAIFKHPIQAWYVTGTRGVSGESRLVIDSPLMAPIMHKRYDSGSRLRSTVRSEIAHVLVIVDINKVKAYPLGAVADYIGMLALTRITSLDGCNALASIMDLLASGCTDRAPPQKITDADVSYLKALYAANLELLPEAEKADLHDRMIDELAVR
jgi:hypothetical protein